MLAVVERILREKCVDTPELSLLVSQWDFDKRLVAQALQAVVRFFPHFSLHDASHSNTILTQLVRVLGEERLRRLSATDLWLLLEAAYHHDIGMIVTEEQLRTWWSSADFQAHLSRLSEGSDPDLAEAARTVSAAFSPSGPVWSLQVHRAVVLVAADYARRVHSSQSERIINHPFASIGLETPRTSLLPARLFQLLSTVCAHHGRSLADTMTLPYRQSGLGTDSVHPRFAACMLRLGDLLDLDNGRFCPVMMRSMSMPASSLAHVGKHAAITRLRIDSERIDVEAQCKDYDSFEAAEPWFDYLRNEIKGQMAQWADIAPEPPMRFGPLPSLGKIEATLEDFVLLGAGQRPRFEVDREHIMKLVKGANLYSDKFNCIREVLQNAIDATLLRLWHDRWSELPPEQVAKFEPKDMQEELKKLPIQVTFERMKEDPAKPADGHKVSYRVAIKDQGIGMALDDVRYMQRIGASAANEKKRALVNAMPEWMRPSGTFGIGLQSIFMLTDEIHMITRHADTKEPLELTLRQGQRGDLFVVKRLRPEAGKRFDVGTTVEIQLLVDPSAAQFSWSSKDERVRRLMSDFDPLVDTELLAEVEKMRDHMERFARHSPCPILLDGKLVSGEGVEDNHVTDRSWQRIFHENVEVRFRASLHSVGADWRYRGMPVENGFNHVFLKMEVDVFQGKADEYLLMNREKFTEEGASKAWELAKKALGKAWARYLEELRDRTSPDNRDELTAASLVALFNPDWKAAAGDEWHKFKVWEEDGTETELASALQDAPLVEVSFGHSSRENKDVVVYRSPTAPRRLRVAEPKEIVRYLLRQCFDYAKLLPSEKEKSPDGFERTIERFVFSKTRVPALDESAFEEVIVWQVQLGWHAGRRCALPCTSKYEPLAYKSDVHLRLMVVNDAWLGRHMVSPFRVIRGQVEVPNLSRLVDWTSRNAREPISRKDVAMLLRDFIMQADPYVDKAIHDSSERQEVRKGYRLSAVTDELEHLSCEEVK